MARIPRQRLPVIVAIVVTMATAACSPPDRPPSLGAGQAADTLRVLAYNIHHGGGMDSVIDLGRIAALIREVRPDLVAIQEVDSVTSRTNRIDQATELGRLTGLESRFGSFMPYQGGSYGMAVLSSLPIGQTRNLRLPDGDEPRTSLSIDVRLPGSGRVLRFVGIHFYRTEDERLAQSLRLQEYLDQDPGIPTILAGDFNSTPGSAVLDQLALEWRFVDKGADRMTFPSWAAEREIDFVLLRPGGAFEILEARTLDEPVASDHRPIFVRLVVR